MGFCSNSFVYTCHVAFPQLNNCIHIHLSVGLSGRWDRGEWDVLPLIPLFLFPHLSRSSRFRIPCPLFFHEVSLLSTLYSPENTTSKRFTIKKHGRCFCNTAATWRDRFPTDCVISLLYDAWISWKFKPFHDTIISSLWNYEKLANDCCQYTEDFLRVDRTFNCVK